MNDLKISLITVCYNAETTISRCVKSAIKQSFRNLEYIIVDGGSTDNTLPLVNQFKDHINIISSEPDQGIYDAMNKGIKLASGHIIGMLNADDYFTDENVLNNIAISFVKHNVSIVYGDIDFVNHSGKVIRKWRSGKYSKGLFNWGWMPPHPAFYCKKNLFSQFGFYSLKYGTAADYELMLRFMHINNVTAFYLNKVIVNMQTGGVSNKNLGSRFKSLYFDFKAMQKNNIAVPLLTLIFKPLRKVIQYFNIQLMLTC